MICNFDMEALRTMVEGVEQGSFTRAASRLGRSQSAISMQLKKLEERAGVPLFVRKGRGLVPTEAGEVLLTFARKIIALNDEAALSLGVIQAEASVKLGLPQDFFEDILPDTITAFEDRLENVHVEVRAGRNFLLEEEVNAGRLDAAIAFFPQGSHAHGDLIATLPTFWVGGDGCRVRPGKDRLPLVLFDHPCLFRSTALKALEDGNLNWRVVLTTPSLPGIWAAVRAGKGISLRTRHGIPEGVSVLRNDTGFPKPPPVEVRLLTAADMSASGRKLGEILREVAASHLAPLALSSWMD
ncbi:LysR family transcriptional regulator [Stappia sp.]|uniref:LysR family transcriptional regulator n=1 Tax=Stappia sp. TaxID=1870903 RepID=UPI003A9940AA